LLATLNKLLKGRGRISQPGRWIFPGRDFYWPKEAMMSASTDHKWRPETRLVHSGTLRSPFGETSEALFLTQGFVYENSATAEARFKGESTGYQYSRFSNPTVAMFEARMAAFERGGIWDLDSMVEDLDKSDSGRVFVFFAFFRLLVFSQELSGIASAPSP